MDDDPRQRYHLVPRPVARTARDYPDPRGSGASLSSAATYSGTGTSSELASSGSCPAITPSRRASAEFYRSLGSAFAPRDVSLRTFSPCHVKDVFWTLG